MNVCEGSSCRYTPLAQISVTQLSVTHDVLDLCPGGAACASHIQRGETCVFDTQRHLGAQTVTDFFEQEGIGDFGDESVKLFYQSRKVPVTARLECFL